MDISNRKMGLFSMVRQLVYERQQRHKIGMDNKPEGAPKSPSLWYASNIPRETLIIKLSQARKKPQCCAVKINKL